MPPYINFVVFNPGYMVFNVLSWCGGQLTGPYVQKAGDCWPSPGPWPNKPGVGRHSILQPLHLIPQPLYTTKWGLHPCIKALQTAWTAPLWQSPFTIHTPASCSILNTFVSPSSVCIPFGCYALTLVVQDTEDSFLFESLSEICYALKLVQDTESGVLFESLSEICCGSLG